MGIPVLILGESGSGKSTSLRNFAEDEIGVFNVASKPMPFRRKFRNIANKPTYGAIKNGLRKAALKRYVVDDSQYLMAFESFRKAKETGYGKFTDMAVNFEGLIECAIEETPSDVIVYFLHHIENTDYGRVKAKTLGKMLDNQLTIEGLFSIVLMTQVDGGNHYFLTQSDGTNPCKTPMEMFDEIRIENDLKMVDETIRKYYNIQEEEK